MMSRKKFIQLDVAHLTGVTRLLTAVEVGVFVTILFDSEVTGRPVAISSFWGPSLGITHKRLKSILHHLQKEGLIDHHDGFVHVNLPSPNDRRSLVSK